MGGRETRMGRGIVSKRSVARPRPGSSKHSLRTVRNAAAASGVCSRSLGGYICIQIEYYSVPNQYTPYSCSFTIVVVHVLIVAVVVVECSPTSPQTNKTKILVCTLSPLPLSLHTRPRLDAVMGVASTAMCWHCRCSSTSDKHITADR